MKYILDHTVINLEWFDYVAMVFFAAVCIYVHVKLKKDRKNKEALQNELSSKNAREANDAEKARRDSIAPENSK